jgi:hypothetical protein
MRRGASRNVYGLLIVAMVLVAFVLQYHWMQRVRESGADGIAPNTFAEKLSRWMLHKRGVSLDDPAVLGQIGTERIPCETCGGSGQEFGPDGTIGSCPICQGVGFGLVRKFSPDENICPFCVGMGRAIQPDTREVVICPRCKGRGLIGPAAAPSSPPAE